jgi:hypothetical protein
MLNAEKCFNFFSGLRNKYRSDDLRIYSGDLFVELGIAKPVKG